jgi:hypothetical protein
MGALTRSTAWSDPVRQRPRQRCKVAEDNAKAYTQVSDGACRARSRGGFAFQSGGRSYFERPRLPAARPLRTRRRHDRSLWDRRLVPSFGLARVGPSFLSLGHMVRSREPADALLRRWGLATRLSRRHARRQDPLCLRRRNLRWRHASTEGRRRLSHVLRRSLIVRHESFQAGRPHGAPEGIVTAFKPCRAFNGRLANADSDFFPHAAVYNTFNVQRHLVSAKTHRASH